MGEKNLKKKWKIPLYKIYSDEDDLRLISQVIKRGTNWAIGPEIEEFENAIKEQVHTDYCVAFNSGTSALHAAFLAYGFKPDDEIIVPSFSFISTANSVLFVNAVPTFADIEEETFGLEPSSISKKISPKTKAIVPMDYGGLSCNIPEIKKISEENNLVLIEDSAEALGASINGKKTGSIADSSIFSFCGNKIITTGEGGAVVTNSKLIYEKLQSIRSHGRFDKINYFDDPQQTQYFDLGYNWRISSMTAALGISQIKKLDKLIKMRQEHAKFLSTELSKISQIRLHKAPKGYEHIYQMFTIRLPDKKTRDDLHNFLIKKQIFSKVYFYPIHLTSFYQKKLKTERGLLPITEKISEQVLTLPMYPNMTSEEKNYLISSIHEFFEQ